MNLGKKGSIPRKGPPPKTGLGRFVLKLRQRKIMTTLAAFIGGGWLLLEFVHWILIDHYHLPETVLDKLRDDPRFREIVEAQKKVYDGLVKKYADL